MQLNQFLITLNYFEIELVAHSAIFSVSIYSFIDLHTNNIDYH